MNNSLFDLAQYEKPKPKKINRRKFDFDFIYTDSSGKGLCCMAIQTGLKYGIQSGYKGCVRLDEFSGRHKVTFVDCNYKKYDHKKHLTSIKQFEPKYATVRDIMSKQQCDKAGIKFFTFSQIMNYAYELAEYVENVILIPKIDVIDKIPADKFMLGYSIPTSHGGTNIPIEKFSNHKVHLLGGSWIKQLDRIERYDFIVSCDNNMLNKRAIYGNFVYPDGETGNLTDFGLSPSNHWHVAAVLSFGNIAKKLSEVFGK